MGRRGRGIGGNSGSVVLRRTVTVMAVLRRSRRGLTTREVAERVAEALGEDMAPRVARRYISALADAGPRAGYVLRSADGVHVLDDPADRTRTDRVTG